MRTLKVIGAVFTRLWTIDHVFSLVFIRSENLRFSAWKPCQFSSYHENHTTFVNTTSWTKISNFPKMKLVRNLNKLIVVHMVVKMSHTLTLGLTDFSFSSSNSIHVKYSQMLTQAIVTCTTIWSFTAISSSNSLSLLKELKSRCVKINSIDGTWNEPQKNKNKWK